MRKLIYYLLLFNPTLLLAQQNGSLDSLFGTNGSTKYAFYPNKLTALSSVIKIFSDGKGDTYLYGTSSISDGITRLCMTRLKPDGKTDSSFGLNGRVYFASSQWLNASTSLIHIGVDSLNRIVFGRTDFSVLRFLSTGSADATFGTNGYMKFNPSGFSSIAIKALHVLPSGKILALGNGSSSGTVCLTVRFNENGSLDSTFNSSGIVIGAFNTGIYKNEGIGLHVQLDGKIVVVGNAYNQYNSDFGLTRYHANGLLDSSFGSNGVNKVNFDYGDDFVSKTSLSSQGGLLVLGTMKLLSGSTNTIVVKFLPNGLIDPSFGVSGKYVTSSTNLFFGWRNDCALFGYINSGDVTLKNYLKTGSLDSSFGNAGTLVIDKSTYPLLNLNSLIVYDSNHLVFGGYIDSLNNRGFGFIKVDGLGRIDSTMGLNGLGFIQMGTSYLNTTSSGKLSKISVQPDKKIVVVGSATPGSYRRILISRFLPNGQKDSAFGVNGTLLLDEGMAKGVLSMPDNSILVAGYINPNNIKKAMLFKLKSDGTYDSTFAVNGRNVVGTQLANGLNEFNDIDLQSDGKIIVTGSGLGRFLANGQLDSSFGVNGFNQGIYGLNSVVLKDNSIVVAGDTILSKYSANGEVRMWFYHEKWSQYCGMGTGTVFFKYSYYEPLIDNDDNIFVRGGNSFDPEYNTNIPCLYGNFGAVQFLFNKDGVPVSSFGTGGKIITYGPDQKTGVLSLGSKVLCYSTYYSSYTIYQNLPNGSPYGPFGGGGKIVFNLPITGSSTLPIPFHPCFQSDSTVVSSFLSLDTIFFVRHFIRKDKLVDFTVTTQKTGLLSDTFQLHASGSLGISRYRWMIDNVVYLNGTDSSSAEPYIRFLSIGSKSIKLIGIANDGEISEKVKSDFIIVCALDFGALSTFAEPLTPIQLSPNCMPSPASYRWEIEGNPLFFPGYHLGATSPYFRYLDTGAFSVKLTARYANGDSLTLVKPKYFRINDLSFTQDKSFSILDSPYFHFYAVSKPAAKRYVWSASKASGQPGNPISFPTGNELQAITIAVTDTGWYNVQLTAYYDSLNYLFEQKFKAFYVGIIPQTNKPVAAFAANKVYGKIDELFYFTDTSLYYPNKWEWTFIPDNIWLVSGDYHSQNPIVSFYANGLYAVKLKVSNAFGSDSVLKQAYINIGAVGVEPIDQSNDALKIYPNPANTFLTLKSPVLNNSHLKIYSILGSLEIEKVLSNELELIDISGLAAGTYQVIVENQESLFTSKLVILR